MPFGGALVKDVIVHGSLIVVIIDVPIDVFL